RSHRHREMKRHNPDNLFAQAPCASPSAALSASRYFQVPPKRASLSRISSCSCGLEDQAFDLLRQAITILESVCDHTKRKCLNVSDRFFLCSPINQNAVKLINLGDPSSVVFLFKFDGKIHFSSSLPDASFQLQSQKLRCLDGIFHWEFAKDLFTKTVDDQRNGVFLRDAALLQIK